jgi:hypothetical protein
VTEEWLIHLHVHFHEHKRKTHVRRKSKLIKGENVSSTRIQTSYSNTHTAMKASQFVSLSIHKLKAY